MYLDAAVNYNFLSLENREQQLKDVIRECQIYQKTASYRRTMISISQVLLNYRSVFFMIPLTSFPINSADSSSNLIYDKDLRCATAEDIWNIFSFLSEKRINYQRPLTEEIDQYLNNQIITDSMYNNYELKQKIQLSIFITLLKNNIDRDLVCIAALSHTPMNISDNQYVEERGLMSIENMQAFMKPVYPISTLYPVAYAFGMTLSEVFFLLFALVDNCSHYHISRLLYSMFEPTDLIKHLLIHQDVARKQHRFMYAFVIGVRRRIAPFLRTKAIMNAIIAARSRIGGQECRGIFSLPTELLLKIYESTYSDAEKARVYIWFDIVSIIYKRSREILEDEIANMFDLSASMQLRSNQEMQLSNIAVFEKGYELMHVRSRISSLEKLNAYLQDIIKLNM